MHKRTGHFSTNPNLLQKFIKYEDKFKFLSLDWLPIGYMNSNYGKDNNVILFWIMQMKFYIHLCSAIVLSKSKETTIIQNRIYGIFCVIYIGWPFSMTIIGPGAARSLLNFGWPKRNPINKRWSLICGRTFFSAILVAAPFDISLQLSSSSSSYWCHHTAKISFISNQWHNQRRMSPFFFSPHFWLYLNICRDYICENCDMKINLFYHTIPVDFWQINVK